MLRSFKSFAALAGLTVALGAASPAQAAVRTGTLTCDIISGGTVIIATHKGLSCRYDSLGGRHELYNGEINKFGVDLSITRNGRLIWAVFEPAFEPGGLGGTYAGVSAEATVGAGVGANVLVGGGHGGVTLQPISLQGQSGFGAAAGISSMTLTAYAPAEETVEVVRPPRHRYTHHRYTHHRYRPVHHYTYHKGKKVRHY